MLVSLGFDSFKMIIALLTKVVIFYIQVTIVEMRVLVFEKLIGVIFKVYWVILDLLNISLYKLFK